MNRLPGFFLCVALLSFAGCARFQSRPLSAADTAAQLENRSLTNSSLKTFLERNLQRDWTDWPAKAWDLDMLTFAAFYYHPDLDLARAQWQVAKGGVRTARGRRNPVLTATPGYSSSALNGLSPWLPAVNLDIPLETAGKRGHRIAAAQHLSEAARLKVASAAWQVRSNLRSSLVDLIGARQREALLQKQLAAQQQVLVMLEQRLRAGAITSSELALSRVAQAKTRLDLTDAQRLAAEAGARLSQAMGVPAVALEGLDLSFDLPQLPRAANDLTALEARRQALRGRADILAALAEYAATEATLQLEIAKQYPDVHLNPGYQFDQGNNKWTLGLTVELPILNQNQGPIAEAQGRRVESAARFKALQAKVLGDIERAVAVFRITANNLTAAQSLTSAQARQREAVEAQLKAGAADQLDLLNSQVEFGVTDLVRLDGEIKVQQAFGALEDAVQRPLELPEAIFHTGQSNPP